MTTYQFMVDGEPVGEWIDAPDDDVASAVVSILVGDIGWKRDGRRCTPDHMDPALLLFIQMRQADFVAALRSYRCDIVQPFTDERRFDHRGYRIARFTEAYSPASVAGT